MDEATILGRIEELQNELATLRSRKRSTVPKNLLMEFGEYKRYGRQMILDQFGLPAQLKLRQARILCIGAGGLGCPCLLYLATAGVGHITVMDHDSVEMSNLHRQIAHSENTVGTSKVSSIKRVILEFVNCKYGKTAHLIRRNSYVHVESIEEAAAPQSLLRGTVDIDSFDLILDCSDNVSTRYLLNDIAVLHDKVLVSGAAIRAEGQVSVWNLPSNKPTEERGPCLRCVFPTADMDDTDSQNCQDEGVLGTVTGVIGVQMASEAIKLLIGAHDLNPSLLLYHPFSTTQFRQMKIKGRKSSCAACAANGASQLVQDHLNREEGGCWRIETCQNGYEPGPNRISVSELETFLAGGRSQLVDVRSKAEYSIAAIDGSQNIPLRQLAVASFKPDQEYLVICRRGNDSRTATKLLAEKGIQAQDVMGGLEAWSKTCAGKFPDY